MGLVAQDEPRAEHELARAPRARQLLVARCDDVLVGELGEELRDELGVDALPALAGQRVDERGRHAACTSELRAASEAPAGAPKD